MNKPGRRARLLATGAALCLVIPALASIAGAAEESEAELAKKLSNPISDMASIPFQFNWDTGVGLNEDLRYTLNIQPVVPFSIGKDWNLIGRWIMPYVSQPILFDGGTTAAGYGDIVFSAFISPKKSSTVWGLGPVFLLPTTTDPYLGSGKWGLGPTAVVLRQTGPWTYGALANHIWSYSNTGDTPRSNVNQTFLQPFLAYSTTTGATVTLQSESTANWEADSGEEWTVPINLLVSKVSRLGPFPLSVAGGVGVYVAAPDGGPDWKLRMAFTLLLPNKK